MKNQGKSGYNQLEGVSAERLAAFLGISDAELYSLKTKETGGYAERGGEKIAYLREQTDRGYQGMRERQWIRILSGTWTKFI